MGVHIMLRVTLELDMGWFQIFEFTLNWILASEFEYRHL